MTLRLVDNRNASKWHAQKMKVDSLYEETPKQFSDPTLTPKQPKYSHKNPKITLKLVDNKNASKWHAQKMKVDTLYEETPKQLFDPTPIQNSRNTA